MNNKTLFFRPSISQMIEIAILAGKEIMKVYSQKGPILTKQKSDYSPLTEADLNSNQTIVSGLKNINTAPIITEETSIPDYTIRKNMPAFWLIDPLDGTKEFINGNNEFTVNISWVERNSINKFEPILGVVYAPAKRVIYWNDDHFAYSGVISEQFELIANTVKKIKCNNLIRPFTIVGSRSHSNSETESYIKILEQKNGPLSFISMGSSLKICLVAEGKASVYPRLSPTMEWDIASAYSIAKKAGCLFYQFDSSSIENTSIPMEFNKEDLLNPYFIVSAK